MTESNQHCTTSVFSKFNGPIMVGLYVLICAVREVYFAQLLRSVPLFILLSVTFTISTVIFAFLSSGSWKVILERSRKNIRDILKINATSALMWGSFLFALRWIQPAAASSLNAAMGPVISAWVAPLMLKSAVSSTTDRVSALGVLMSAAILVFALVSHAPPTALAGVLGAIGSGTFTALNNIYAKRLATAGFRAKEIMVVRFPLLIAASTIAAASSASEQTFAELANTLRTIGPELLIAATGGMIVPLWLLQIGLTSTPIQAVSLMLAAGPLLTFILQTQFNNIPASPLVFLGLSGGALSVIAGLYYRGTIQEGRV